MEQKLKEAAAGLSETRLSFEEVEAAASLGKQTRKITQNPAWVAAAACLALLLCLGLGGYAVKAEAQEYQKAVAFFNEHDLPLDGLTRAEIKAVYRDITTESFSYSKTGEVIRNSLSDGPVGGYEIWQETPSAEEIRNLWNEKKYSGEWLKLMQKQPAYSYRSDFGDVGGRHGHICSYVEHYEGEKLIWSTAITDYWVWGCQAVSDGVIVYGQDYTWSSQQKEMAWLSKLDMEGNLLWTYTADNQFHTENIYAVLENADGSYAVFSRGELNYLCLSQFTVDGERILFNKTEVGNCGIWNTARLGDGYLVQLGSYIDNEHARLVKVDREGNITESFRYDSEDEQYYITDMMEYCGKVYLSAYAIPKENIRDGGSHGEIAAMVEYIVHQKGWDISSEELTPMVRDNYAAVLLVCDPNNGGALQVFYSIPGSLGGELLIGDDGRLIWNTESITSTFFSPATSYFTIGGLCRVYQYAFDEEGVLVGWGKTDEVTNFYR